MCLVCTPTSGSVILAGILLKLGSYGFVRFSLPLFPQASFFFAPLVYSIAIISILYASFTAIRQTDFKRIIAYTSIAHMNLIVLGIFSFNPTCDSYFWVNSWSYLAFQSSQTSGTHLFETREQRNRKKSLFVTRQVNLDSQSFDGTFLVRDSFSILCNEVALHRMWNDIHVWIVR